MKTNMVKKKKSKLPVEHKDFKSSGSTSYMQVILVTYRWVEWPRMEI